jgi:hypothetical protein
LLKLRRIVGPEDEEVTGEWRKYTVEVVIIYALHVILLE